MRIFVSLSLLATLLISSYATTAHATTSDSFSCSGSLIVDESDGFSASCDGDLLVSRLIKSDKNISLSATSSITAGQNAIIEGSGLTLSVGTNDKFYNEQSLQTASVISSSATVNIRTLSVQPYSSSRSVGGNVYISSGGNVVDISSGGDIVLASSTAIRSANILPVETVISVSSVPEPSTNILFFIGLALLCFSKRLQFMSPLLRIQN